MRESMTEFLTAEEQAQDLQTMRRPRHRTHDECFRGAKAAEAATARGIPLTSAAPSVQDFREKAGGPFQQTTGTLG